MPGTPYTGNPTGANVTAPTVAPVVNIPADGDPGQASTWSPSIEDCLDEIALLKITTVPAAIASAVASALGNTRVAKAWGLVVTDGVGGVSLVKGSGVASVAVFAGTGVQVTLSSALADTHFGLVIGQINGSGSFDVIQESITFPRTTTTFVFLAVTPTGVNSLASTVREWSFVVFD